MGWRERDRGYCDWCEQLVGEWDTLFERGEFDASSHGEMLRDFGQFQTLFGEILHDIVLEEESSVSNSVSSS